VLVAACEIMLARLTFAPLSWWDVATSLLGLTLGSALLVATVRRATAGSAREAFALGFALRFPLALVLARLLANAAHGRSAVLGSLLLLAVGALWPLIGAWRAGRGHDVDLPNAWIVAGFAGATLAAFGLRAGAPVVPFDGNAVSGSLAILPSLAVCAGLLALWSAAALLTARPRLLPAAVALTLAVAAWPRATPLVRWPPSEGAPPPASGAPDIVLLTVDTLRADAARDMRSFARLRRAGVVFDDARAPAPWTLPSLATLMTGRSPSTHGALRLADGGIGAIDPALPTLAEILARAGYDTAAVVAPNAFASSSFGLPRGFAHFAYLLRRAAFAQPLSSNDVVARPLVPSLLTRAGLGGRRRFGGADSVAEEAIAVLEQRRDRPLFLWVHFLDCHVPYRHAEAAPLPFQLRTALSGADPVEMARRGVLDAETAWTAYRNEIAHVDRALERILDHVAGASRPAIVALTADHGEELFDHGGFEHGHTFHEELLRVPLVIAGLPTRRAGTVEARPVGLGDLAPTFLQAAGLPHVGQSLGEPIAPRQFVASNLLYGSAERYAVRDGRWKLIAGAKRPPRLYDLAQDPAERVDYAVVRPDVVQRLARPPRPRPRAQPRRAALTPAQENAMRVLGYLNDR
jgi:arylsulfatase A-like enzyme